MNIFIFRKTENSIKDPTRLDLSSVNSTEFLPEIYIKAVPEEDAFIPVESKQERRKSNRIRSSSSINSEKHAKNKPYKTRSNESSSSNKSVNRSPKKSEEFVQGYSIPGGRQPLIQGVGGKSNPWNKKITAVLKNK